ncbi:bifunctional 2-polyprenyl-6-hydroxyphenol methylase/3-demethylubiquinol 3-O-methyltransferase UbiG [Kribbella sp. VKM Ac-2566]|uniref:class I SAM-dependent methyltransferase n=1 Tax=Kribbella sp. VKM Ac-2566 TaxID=2512218 RepID=UPI0010DA00E2|nr:class I SAM-dependent methyltransferase [Kribbella sp. VKM Ac-2566]TDX03146.1 methyltransferase family protein [Kribbella sp. VKM Ac-2566]
MTTDMTTTDTTTTDTATTDSASAEALVGRMFGAALGAAELYTIYLGDVHGLYRAIGDAGPTTATELADRTGLDHRYLVEWLQSQAISGLLTIDGTDVWTDRYELAPGIRETLLDPANPFFAGGLAAILPAVGHAFPQLVEAFRTGAGVPYAAYGQEAVIAQEALNRPAYANSLIAEWVPAVPGLHDVLSRGARVADLGTGAGWSAIELAKAYPAVRVDGYDNDEDSITRARRNAAEQGVADRVDFEVRDITAIAAGGTPYDVVTFFECLHDFAHPVEALTAAREALAPGGSVIVMDERADEVLAAPGDEVQRFLAAASVIWCTPQGRVDEDSEVVGTMLRPDRLRQLAGRAGFGTVDVLPIDHPFWRFYRLTP